MKKTAYVPVIMYPELKERLANRAKKLDRTSSWLAAYYIERGLDLDGEPKIEPKEKEK